MKHLFSQFSQMKLVLGAGFLSLTSISYSQTLSGNLLNLSGNTTEYNWISLGDGTTEWNGSAWVPKVYGGLMANRTSPLYGGTEGVSIFTNFDKDLTLQPFKGNIVLYPGGDALSTWGNVGIGIDDPKANLHIRGRAVGTTPVLKLETKTGTLVKMGWKKGQDFQIGSHDSFSFTPYMKFYHNDLRIKMLKETVFDANVIYEEGTKFNDFLGDKVTFYGPKDASSSYAMGVNDNVLYYKSNNGHAWYSKANGQSNGDGAVMYLSTNGNLGIGTTNPNHELVVEGDDPAFQIRDNSTNDSPNAARLELLERDGGNFGAGAFMFWNGDKNHLYVGTKKGGNNTNVMVVGRKNSNVGIGTSNLEAAENEDYRLLVNGFVKATKVVVETGWADYVFEKDYRLRSLAEVESFIDKNGHLPEIPSAKEVEENGVTLGEIEAKLLLKIEELTLYTITQQKQLEEQRKLIDKLLEERN